MKRKSFLALSPRGIPAVRSVRPGLAHNYTVGGAIRGLQPPPPVWWI